LPGFTAFRREWIEMLANFTAQVNAELTVGGVEETVDVTAESPLVDVQSSAVARAVTKDIIREIPTGGTMYQLTAMMVGVNMTGGPADYGNQYLHWDGFDINSNIRLQQITFAGGVTFGKTSQTTVRLLPRCRKRWGICRGSSAITQRAGNLLGK
jgi:hypothetical protein